MSWTCILCDLPHEGEPAERAKNGPVCRACVADDKRLVAKLRKTRKKRKKRRKR